MEHLDHISLTLQLIASAVTLWAIWQMGNKSLLGPSLSIVSDFAFFTLDVYLHLWGLIPFCVILLALHIRNLIKWRRDIRNERDARPSTLTKWRDYAREAMEAED